MVLSFKLFVAFTKSKFQALRLANGTSLNKTLYKVFPFNLFTTICQLVMVHLSLDFFSHSVVRLVFDWIWYIFFSTHEPIYLNRRMWSKMLCWNLYFYWIWHLHFNMFISNKNLRFQKTLWVKRTLAATFEWSVVNVFVASVSCW